MKCEQICYLAVLVGLNNFSLNCLFVVDLHSGKNDMRAPLVTAMDQSLVKRTCSPDLALPITAVGSVCTVCKGL